MVQWVPEPSFLLLSLYGGGMKVMFLFGERMLSLKLYIHEKTDKCIQNIQVVLKINNLGGGFKYLFMFTPIWGRFPFWLIFFNGVETTNQITLWKPETRNLDLLIYIYIFAPRVLEMITPLHRTRKLRLWFVKSPRYRKVRFRNWNSIASKKKVWGFPNTSWEILQVFFWFDLRCVKRQIVVTM